MISCQQSLLCVCLWSYALFLYVGATQVSLTRMSNETKVTESPHRQGGSLNINEQSSR